MTWQNYQVPQNTTPPPQQAATPPPQQAPQPPKSPSIQDQRADMIREDFDDYINRFSWANKELVERYQNAGDFTQQMIDATKTDLQANQAKAQRTKDRRMQAMGLSGQGQSKSSKLNQAATGAGLSNYLRDTEQDRKNDIIL